MVYMLVLMNTKKLVLGTDVIREGFSGAISGLTFGFVSQETISEGLLTKIGEKVSGAFNKVKDAYVSGFNNVKDGITKVINDPEGAFNSCI